MVKEILVPLDGSELAESVLPYVETVAAKTGAELILLTAVHGHEIGISGYPGETDIRDRSDEVRSYLESRCDELRRRGLPVRSEIHYGPEADAILNAAADHVVDLIAMSTHGRSGIGRWIMGSVADRVLHNTHRPLLLVRARESAGEAVELPAVNKILVPLDGSPMAGAVLPYVRDFAKHLGASVVLFQALATTETYVPAEMGHYRLGDLLNKMEEGAHRYLARIAGEMASDGVAARGVVTFGPAVNEIADAAKREGADLIAMATHGRSGVGRWIIGSIADAVVRRTSLPCLVIRPNQAEGDA
jgi:nucleotide-binding universal stress UspA family protein